MPYRPPKLHDPAALRDGMRSAEYAPLFAGKTAEEAHAIIDADRPMTVVQDGVAYPVVSLAHLWGYPRGCTTEEVRAAMGEAE